MKPTKYQEDFQREKGKSHLLVGHDGQDYNSFAFVSWLIEGIELLKKQNLILRNENQTLHNESQDDIF